MLIKISWLCLLSAAGLFIWAGIWMMDRSLNEEVLIVEEPEKNIGQQEIGTCTLELHVLNTGDQPHRILGIEGR